MYDMLKAKVDRLAGKTYFVKKETKNMDNDGELFGSRLTLDGAGGQTDDTRSTIRAPLINHPFYHDNSAVHIVGTSLDV